MSAIGDTQRQGLRPAQLFGRRLRMSNENEEVMQAMAQLRREKRDRMIEDEIETSQCKIRYYK